MESWVLDERLDAYTLPPTSNANAAEILWPSGIKNPSLHCPWFGGLGPEHAAWVDGRAEWMEAARCRDLDGFVQAAEAAHFDILPIANGVDPADLVFGDLGHEGIRTGIWALIARGHLELEQSHRSEAEFHLRAAMSIALALLRRDGNLRGMETGHKALEVVLQHFEALEIAAGRLDKARELGMLHDALPPFESCTGILNHGMPRSAAVASGLPFVRQAALDRTLPLAMRVRAAFAVAYSWTGNPWNLLRGAGPGRGAALEEMAASPELRPWVSIVTSIPVPSGAERLSALWEMVVAGLPRT